jgi:uncharacterized protein YjbI with pentapeptide repeats
MGAVGGGVAALRVVVVVGVVNATAGVVVAVAGVVVAASGVVVMVGVVVQASEVVVAGVVVIEASDLLARAVGAVAVLTASLRVSRVAAVWVAATRLAGDVEVRVGSSLGIRRGGVRPCMRSQNGLAIATDAKLKMSNATQTTLSRRVAVRGVGAQPVIVRVGRSAAGAVAAGAALTGALLAGAALAGAALTGAAVAAAAPAGTPLAGAALTGAAVAAAAPAGTLLAGAALTGAAVAAAAPAGTPLAGTVITGTSMTGAGFTGAVLTGAAIAGPAVTGVVLDGAVVTEALVTVGVGGGTGTRMTAGSTSPRARSQSGLATAATPKLDRSNSLCLLKSFISSFPPVGTPVYLPSALPRSQIACAQGTCEIQLPGTPASSRSTPPRLVSALPAPPHTPEIGPTRCSESLQGHDYTYAKTPANQHLSSRPQFAGKPAE